MVGPTGFTSLLLCGLMLSSCGSKAASSGHPGSGEAGGSSAGGAGGAAGGSGGMGGTGGDAGMSGEAGSGCSPATCTTDPSCFRTFELGFPAADAGDSPAATVVPGGDVGVGLQNFDDRTGEIKVQLVRVSSGVTSRLDISSQVSFPASMVSTQSHAYLTGGVVGGSKASMVFEVADDLESLSGLPAFDPSAILFISTMAATRDGSLAILTRLNDGMTSPTVVGFLNVTGAQVGGWTHTPFEGDFRTAPHLVPDETGVAVAYIAKGALAAWLGHVVRSTETWETPVELTAPDNKDTIVDLAALPLSDGWVVAIQQYSGLLRIVHVHADRSLDTLDLSAGALGYGPTVQMARSPGALWVAARGPNPDEITVWRFEDPPDLGRSPPPLRLQLPMPADILTFLDARDGSIRFVAGNGNPGNYNLYMGQVDGCF